jgi:hypothetical protein
MGEGQQADTAWHWRKDRGVAASLQREDMEPARTPHRWGKIETGVMWRAD